MAFNGDGVVIFCDVDLTHQKANAFVKDAMAKAGPKLAEELANIGYCELGHAVITRGYNLATSHLIFMPYMERDNHARHLDYLLLHQAVRGVLSLASLYHLQSLAIPVVSNILPNSKKENEVELIISGIAESFNSDSLKEISLFF